MQSKVWEGWLELEAVSKDDESCAGSAVHDGDHSNRYTISLLRLDSFSHSLLHFTKDITLHSLRICLRKMVEAPVRGLTPLPLPCQQLKCAPFPKVL